MDHIFLDANSTTPIDPQVVEAIVATLRGNIANPASPHQPGQRARGLLDDFRSEICRRIGGDRDQRLIFTSGGTEANNLAVIGIARAASTRQPTKSAARNEVVVSAIEHPSVLSAAEFLKTIGFTIRILPVDQQGVAQVDCLDRLVNDRTCVVSLMLVNNETGVIQPVPEAAAICRQRGVPLHCDAVQAVGKIEVDYRQLQVSAMTLTPHKLHGPRGIGALVVDRDLSLLPQIFGGSQQLGLRPGTEDVALAAGFAKAIALAVDGLKENSQIMGELLLRLEQTMVASCSECVIAGSQARRAPHTASICFPGVDRQALLMAVDAGGVAISTGSACTSGSSEPSHVLRAMGCDERLIEGSIRVSLSRCTTAFDIDRAARVILSCVNNLRSAKSRGK